MRFLIGFVAALALLAQSPAPPDARALLVRADNAVLMADTVRLAGKETIEIELQAGSRSASANSFSIERSTRGRFRLETSETDSPLLMIADGQTVSTYFERSQTYNTAEASDIPANDAFGRLKFSRDPALISSASLAREETLEYHHHPVLCYVAHAAYRSIPFNHGANDVTRTVWIAKDGEQILRDKWEFTSNAGPERSSLKVEVTTDYTAIEFGIPLPDNLFVFRPPPKSAAIESLGVIQMKVSGSPSLLYDVKPDYSPEARDAGLQGTVSLYVEINNDGAPGTVHVMQGLGLGLDERAVAAMKKFKYQARTGEIPATPRTIDVDVQFRLDPAAQWSVVSEAYSVAVPNNPKVQRVLKPIPTRYLAPVTVCESAGTWMVKFTVGKDGVPRDITGSLDAAANAVQGWQFQPATVDDVPAEAQAEVEFDCQPHGMILTDEKFPEQVYRVGGGVSAPVLVSKVEPVYSEEARLAKVQGKTTLQVEISPGGKATHLVVVESLGSGLDEKAMEAVKRWRFQPGMKNGAPVRVEATIEVNFRLL